MVIVWIGIFAFGLFCLVRPDYMCRRRNRGNDQRNIFRNHNAGNDNNSDGENKEETEQDPRDLRFFRIFGIVVMALMVGALVLDYLV